MPKRVSACYADKLQPRCSGSVPLSVKSGRFVASGREACVLQRLPSTSLAYWQGRNQLRAQTGGKFHTLFDAVSRAMAHTPRSSSLVENLNSRLRAYFTLRHHLGSSYLDLLRFFLNHRRFMRSRRAERNGKSPRELMTGQGHPHRQTLLGLAPLQPQRA